MRVPAVLTFFTVSLLALASRSSAGWQSPLTVAVGAGTDFRLGATVEVGGNGAVVIAWDASGVIRARIREPGKPLGPTQTLSSSGKDPGAAAGGDGTLAVYWRDNSQIRARVRPPGLAWQPTESLVGVPYPFGLAMTGATNAAVLSAAGGLFSGTARVLSQRRISGGQFGVPQFLSGDSYDAGLARGAASPRGPALVAWETNGPVEARISPDGISWGPILPISPLGRKATLVGVGSSSSGIGVVAWNENGAFYARLRTAGTAFGGAVGLGRSGTGVATGANGTVAVVMQQVLSKPQVRVRPPGKPFGPPETLALRVAQRLAVTANGTVIAMGSDNISGSTTRYHCLAQVRPPGGRFGPLKDVSGEVVVNYPAYPDVELAAGDKGSAFAVCAGRQLVKAAEFTP